jgi:adenylyltransferase/sulfurtransferase
VTSPIDPRFDRQRRFAPLGDRGQERLGSARVLLVGCGALGGVLAQTLHRAGVGTLVLVDRDVVEPTNLPRQVLFDERHAAEGTPKVAATAESLARVGGPTVLEQRAVHLDARNLPELADGCDLVLDGTDNLATRYLVNDWCVEHGVPWVYGGAVGSSGLVMPVLPGSGPCLRCLFPDPPPPGSLPTCDTAGVILPAVGATASLQAGLALRLLAGETPPEPGLLEIDAWSGHVRRVRVPRDPDCPCCARGERTFLEARTREPILLCGRNTVQVQGDGRRPDPDALAARLEGAVDSLRRAGPILRFAVEDCAVTLFPDGRALIEGTDDADRARALYDRWVGA